ncbi:MAG TPA: nucleotidyltransferase family protein [Burkholderiaceae bacterium]|nr:nucleotidyltransferase family protein [Burkholderiaceae bacterium]
MEPAAPLRALLDVLAGSADDSPRRLFAQGWASFVDEASHHGVAALASLGLAGCDAVPPAAVRALEGHYLKNRLRNLRLYAHVGALLERLSAESVDVIVLKGAYLAQAVYPDPALRAMSDADLLVRRRDLERATATMQAMGWRQSPMSRASGHQLPTFELDGVQVELHWNIEDDGAPFTVDVAALWSLAVPMRIGRARALSLSPEDLLLHLCLHSAYGHGWKQFDGGLRHLVDIAAVVRHHATNLDWPAVVQRAQAWRAQRCVGLCLMTARDLLQVAVPQGVLDRLSVPPIQWIVVARELTLGRHYARLQSQLPVLARFWLDKGWRRLPRGARWRAYLRPTSESLRSVYPTLAPTAALSLLAHWKDLAGDLLRITFDRRCRALLRTERGRRSLLSWLEGESAGAAGLDRANDEAADHCAVAQLGGHR